MDDYPKKFFGEKKLEAGLRWEKENEKTSVLNASLDAIQGDVSLLGSAPAAFPMFYFVSS